MPFLRDEEIAKLIAADPSVAPDFKVEAGADWHERIQAGSLDLDIGEIYIPGTKPGKLGAYNKPRTTVALAQGQTAIVKTRQSVNIPANYGAIAFPPARLSLKGMLTTNPGHLDPGYSGYIHLTLINMGKLPITLNAGDRIVRVLFYAMSGDAKNPFKMQQGASAITEELLESLSHDFLDISTRAKEAARDEVWRSQLFQSYGVPVLAAMLGAAASFGTAYLFEREKDEDRVAAIESRIDRLEGRIGGLGASVNLDQVEGRLDKIEKKLK